MPGLSAGTVLLLWICRVVMSHYRFRANVGRRLPERGSEDTASSPHPQPPSGPKWGAVAIVGLHFLSRLLSVTRLFVFEARLPLVAVPWAASWLASSARSVVPPLDARCRTPANGLSVLAYQWRMEP